MTRENAPAPFETLITDGDITVPWWIGLLAATANDLSQRTTAALEAMVWLRSRRRAPTSFVSIVEAFGADSDVIRREIARSAHKALLDKIVEKEAGWREIASWYCGETITPYPASWLFELAHLERCAAITEVVRAERGEVEAYSHRVARKAA